MKKNKGKRERAIERLEEFVDSENEQIAFKACVEILNRDKQPPEEMKKEDWFINDE